MQRIRPFLLIAAVLVVAILAAALLLRSNRNGDPPTTEPSPSQSNQPRQSTAPTSSPSLSVDRERKNPADAVVTLEEFGDYQCPPCGELHPTLKKLKQEFGPNLNLVFRNLPLTTIHKNAMVAAQAAEAARTQGRFWEMHDLLYENQDRWTEDPNPRSIFLKFASGLGLDTKRFARDMADKQVQLRIEVDQDAATQLEITGTPTILIDGRKLRPEGTTPEGIRKGIELMMARKAGPTR